MLPKSARLSKKDISFVLRKPTAKLFSPHITIVFHMKEATPSRQTRQDVASFGLALNKKLFINSVDMHRKRRVLYARIREALPSLAPSDSKRVLVVVIPKLSFFDLAPKEQTAVIEGLLGRIHQSESNTSGSSSSQIK